MDREYSGIDRLLMRAQRALEQAVPPPADPARPNPAGAAQDGPLDAAARRHAAGLMRVNHAGEVAAQALYRGHAAVAQSESVKAHMLAAAEEERDHLHWCEQRLAELGEKPSALDPLWYAGSFAIGAAAGLAGDRWSLGFVEETEKQVSEHLTGHLDTLPPEDRRSRAVIQAMRADEERHGAEAAAAGAQPLPGPIQSLMRAVARVMTRTAYWF